MSAACVVCRVHGQIGSFTTIACLPLRAVGKGWIREGNLVQGSWQARHYHPRWALYPRQGLNEC